MRRPIAVLAAVAALPLLAGCGGSSKKSQASTAATTTAQRYGCQVVKAPPPKGPQHLTRPATRLDPNKTWLATVDTNCGSFTITLDAKRAPITASSVGALIRRGFYDGLTFHRIVRGFVIQGGDPLGTGEGGPGYQVVEPPPAGIHYTRGTVAMAKTQTDPRGASGSQFFVVTAEDATTSAGLTPDYALLGRVTSGMDTVLRISFVPADPNTGTPAIPVVMRRVTLQSK